MAEGQSALVRIRLAEGHIKRAFDLAQMVPSDSSKINLFRATARDLHCIRERFETDFVIVETTATTEDGFDAEAHTARLADFEEKYFEVMSTLEAIEEVKVVSPGTPTTQVSKSRVALPKISLPKFDGSPQQWANFSNLFITLVANNADISSVEKLAYLKTALNGEPLGMVQSLPISEANYEVAWKLLVGRYENKRLIVSVHVEALLKAPMAASDSPKALRNLLTIVNENLLALRALDVPCPKFIKSSPKDRYKIAKEHKLCLNCLSPSHASKDCSSSSCRYCGSRHHSLLHFEQQTAINPGPGKDASTTLIEPNPATVAVAAALPSEARTVLLSTAQVHVFDSSGTPMVVRALLDTASQASFVTESCLQRLRLTRRRSHLPVQGLANTSVNVAKSCASIVMAPVGSTSPQFAVDVFVISRITSSLPSAKLSARVRGAVAHLKLADPAFDTPGPVDLLIGAELVPRLLTGAKIDGSPVALDSVLGWILMRQVDTQVPSLTATSLCISLLTSHPPLDEVVKRFWELEEFPVTTHKSPEDVKCEEWFSKTHLRSGDGRYSVSLPFRQPLLKLGASRPQALNRFLRLENRLKSDPKLKAMYSEFMSDYVASGHMEEVTESQIPSESYYIPHHCVVKPESSTTKLRVVFDASAKSSSGKGGFKLRKFMSNHQALLDWLPVEDIEIPQPFSLDSDDCVIKVLGLQWNPVSDTYSYKIQPSSGNATKRTILSNLARIFDPLGWLTPLSMFAKHLIQVLWARNLGWDTEPPDDILSNWKNFNTQLSQLSSVTIPRLIRGQAGGSYQLHGFSDSSEIGYAAVVYLRIDNPDGTVLVHLLIAKSKVAPLKVQSLPRLELCGALLLARLLHHVIDAYGATLHFSSVTAWTDSQVTLAWINSSPHELKTFVANRVSHIQELTRPEWWKHVRSEHNPADCGSRGLLPAQIVSHPLWWSGPSWLKKAEDQWPEGIPCIKASDVILLERKVVALGTFISPGDLDTLLERFSRLTRLLRVTACLFRFINNCRHPLEGRAIEELSSKDLNTALEFWIRYVQSMCYRSDLIALKKDQITSPQLRRLLPFIDSKGVIRVGGRLSHSDLPFEQKHPALLPKSNPLTRLIIGHYHEVNQHPGIQALQAILREKFWIMGDKRAITNLVHRCVRCFRASPSSVAPLMGNLPAMRVQQVKPFSSADPKDFTPLTPGHFLTLEPLVTIPEPDLRQVKMNCLHRWQLVSRLHQDFWHRWHRDYLHTLQQRSKWQKRASGLAPNQMVLVKEDRLPPLQWPLGRIVDLHHGTDGVARVATNMPPWRPSVLV
ncbi:uncharacterized protein LOC134528849 [Bacillus rossius redtenbacheri]|uniref:uncharacterized protein LOC134528849 n=1 Tax=Bacillus rossius redtenbacheri TaxID=93214 RepID=UPI002FDCF6CF